MTKSLVRCGAGIPWVLSDIRKALNPQGYLSSPWIEEGLAKILPLSHLYL